MLVDGIFVSKRTHISFNRGFISDYEDDFLAFKLVKLATRLSAILVVKMRMATRFDPTLTFWELMNHVKKWSYKKTVFESYSLSNVMVSNICSHNHFIQNASTYTDTASFRP